MSAGLALVAVLVSPKPVTGSFSWSASRSLPVAGAAYATVTFVSTAAASTASASVSVTVVPLTATGVVAASATLRSVPPRVAFTVNADAAGTELPSSPPSKVTVSSSPFTDAEEYAGGVTLVPVVLFPIRTASLPDRSLSRHWTVSGTSYPTLIACPCRAAVAKVAVTVRPEMDASAAASVEPST